MADKKQPDEGRTPEPQLSGELESFVRSGTGPNDPPPLGSRKRPVNVAGKISLTRTEVALTDDAALWSAIRNRTDAIRGDRYDDFITRVLCEPGDTGLPVCNPGEVSTLTNKTRGPRDIGAPVEAGRKALVDSWGGY